MGQYYLAVILGPEGQSTEFIRAWVSAHSYGIGVKLMEHSYLASPSSAAYHSATQNGEHSYISNDYMSAVEWLLSPKGHFWKSRIVWAGDYADPEHHDSYPDGKLVAVTLQGMAEEQPGKEMIPQPQDMSEYRYIVNHTKKQYVDKSEALTGSNDFRIHPLPLLTAEGNGRGGGDYRASNQHLVGSWARDVISVERYVPSGYELLEAEFRE